MLFIRTNTPGHVQSHLDLAPPSSIIHSPREIRACFSHLWLLPVVLVCNTICVTYYVECSSVDKRDCRVDSDLCDGQDDNGTLDVPGANRPAAKYHVVLVL